MRQFSSRFLVAKMRRVRGYQVVKWGVAFDCFDADLPIPIDLARKVRSEIFEMVNACADD